jgi:hypothetical protein
MPGQYLGVLPSELPFQRLLLSSQTATQLGWAQIPPSQAQHPAWLPHPSSSCSLPVVLLAIGLLRGGGGMGRGQQGLLSPWPLLSLLHQLTAKYPWGLGREDFLLIFFPSEIIPPLVTRISAFGSSGDLTSFPHPFPAPRCSREGAALFPELLALGL